jgi:hypothetical protein
MARKAGTLANLGYVQHFVAFGLGGERIFGCFP